MSCLSNDCYCIVYFNHIDSFGMMSHRNCIFLHKLFFIELKVWRAIMVMDLLGQIVSNHNNFTLLHLENLHDFTNFEY
jgi:hypothetical protein